MKIEIEVKDNKIFVDNDEVEYIGRALTRVDSLLKKELSHDKLESIANKLCGSVDSLKNGKTLYKQIFCYICRKENIQLQHIGNLLNYSYSTVCCASKKVSGYIDVKDKQVLRILNEYELN